MHKKGWLVTILRTLPQDNVVDVYLSVRLEAGTLHVANYLIRTTDYYLAAKVTIIFEKPKCLYIM